jgi:pimeloyl-ACP methyl ester carboxylesterase
MATVTVNRTTLYYEESGAGPALLFMHGTGGTANTWDGQVERLAPYFRCVTYDRRGNLRSPLGDIAQYDPAIHVQDAAELIRALSLAPCILVGSSGGAYIAFHVARNYPELLRGAVLAEPFIPSLDPEGGKAFASFLQKRIQPLLAGSDKRGVVDAFMEYMDPAAWAIVPESGREKYRDNYAALLREAQAVTARTVSADDVRSVKVRCLILTGSNSHATLRTIARTLATGIHDAELVEVEASGHLIYLDKPDAFAEAVLRFARGLQSAVRD